jgi:sialic acid synthase SpsE
LQKILDEIIHRDQYQDKIIAARKIRKGEILTNVMIDQIKTDRKGGIFYDDKMKIIAKVACKEILEGHMVQWDDFFGTYQNVGKGEF